MTGSADGPGRREARALAMLGAAAAAGDEAGLVEAFAEADESAGADAVEEVLLQTHLFAGYPRAIEAIRSWQAWLGRSGRSRGRLVVEPDDPARWRRRGEALCRIVYGPAFEALQRRLARLHPALAEWTLVDGYGKVLARPGPDPARRELAAVGALVALAAERQLASHLRGALHAGVARDVLAAAVREVAARWGGEAAVERLLAEASAGEGG